MRLIAASYGTLDRHPVGFRASLYKKTVRKATLANAQAISIWVQRAVSVLDLCR